MHIILQTKHAEGGISFQNASNKRAKMIDNENNIRNDIHYIREFALSVERVQVQLCNQSASESPLLDDEADDAR